jgi:hypothetical protein
MNRERIEQAKSLLLAADRYGKRFNWFVPRILEEVMAEVDGLTRDELPGGVHRAFGGATATSFVASCGRD